MDAKSEKNGQKIYEDKWLKSMTLLKNSFLDCLEIAINSVFNNYFRKFHVS